MKAHDTVVPLRVPRMALLTIRLFNMTWDRIIAARLSISFKLRKEMKEYKPLIDAV